jgi:hypothetical protein
MRKPRFFWPNSVLIVLPSAPPAAGGARPARCSARPGSRFWLHFLLNEHPRVNAGQARWVGVAPAVHRVRLRADVFGGDRSLRLAVQCRAVGRRGCVAWPRRPSRHLSQLSRDGVAEPRRVRSPPSSSFLSQPSGARLQPWFAQPHASAEPSPTSSWPTCSSPSSAGSSWQVRDSPRALHPAPRSSSRLAPTPPSAPRRQARTSCSRRCGGATCPCASLLWPS